MVRLTSAFIKYRHTASLTTVSPSPPNSPNSSAKNQPNLDELWNRYAQFKKPQISPSTFAKDFTRHRNHIERLPSHSLEDAVLIRDHLLANLTPDAAKRCLTQIKSCCTWAIEEELIEANPFLTMKIRVPKGLTEDADVNPFSKAERDLIIQTFAGDRHYSYYTNYVRFLFFTGARPSEVIALQWKHVGGRLCRPPIAWGKAEDDQTQVASRLLAPSRSQMGRFMPFSCG